MTPSDALPCPFCQRKPERAVNSDAARCPWHTGWLPLAHWNTRATPPAGDVDRSCTCHPDDNPPRPCPKRYALEECRQAALAALRLPEGAAQPARVEALTTPAGLRPVILSGWPRPWSYEENGYNEGPCIKDKNGQVICAMFWPVHHPDATKMVEGEMAYLGLLWSIAVELQQALERHGAQHPTAPGMVSVPVECPCDSEKAIDPHCAAAGMCVRENDSE